MWDHNKTNCTLGNFNLEAYSPTIDGHVWHLKSTVHKGGHKDGHGCVIGDLISEGTFNTEIIEVK